MSKKKKSNFGAAVTGDAKRNKNRGYGYISLPKGVPIFKEKTGQELFDIIPYRVTDKKHPDRDPDVPDSAHKGNPWYKRPFKVHRSIGADNETVLCPKTFGKKCPICEYREEQLADGVKWDDAVGKVSDRVLYVIRPKKNKNHSDELHIWDFSYHNFQKQLYEELEEKPEMGNFPSPEEGITLNVRFAEKKFGKNKFNETSRIDFKDRKKQYKESIIDEAPELDELLKVLSYKELEEKFLEVDGDNDSEGDEGAKDVKKRKKKSLEKKDKKGKKEKKPEGKSKDKKGKKNKCPEGHKFGKDFDAFDICDDCKLRDACGDENEKY